MHRRPLVDMLVRYESRFPADRGVAGRIRALVDAHVDCFERTCRPAHVTASAWVTTPSADHFLLVHHRKLNRWLQPGGHMDGDPDVAAAALREVREETGLRDVSLLGDAALTPFDLDIHIIPARYDADGTMVEDAHEHHDVRLLVVAAGDAVPLVSSESHAVRWFNADELRAVTDEESVLRMLRKTAAAFA
jgi:8-oxo-dGTP pyrophosphatase MutT (NUDIX family)